MENQTKQKSGEQCSGHKCSGHEAGHVHNDSCGHKMVEYEGHRDFVVENHLHHSHNGHCDNHGEWKQAS